MWCKTPPREEVVQRPWGGHLMFLRSSKEARVGEAEQEEGEQWRRKQRGGVPGTGSEASMFLF